MIHVAFKRGYTQYLHVHVAITSDDCRKSGEGKKTSTLHKEMALMMNVQS